MIVAPVNLPNPLTAPTTNKQHKNRILINQMINDQRKVRAAQKIEKAA